MFLHEDNEEIKKLILKAYSIAFVVVSDFDESLEMTFFSRSKDQWYGTLIQNNIRLKILRRVDIILLALRFF